MASCGGLSGRALVHDYVLRSGRRCFPVVDGERISGFITLDAIKEVLWERWAATTVDQAKSSFTEVKAVSPDTELFAVLELLSAEGVAQLPVLESGEFLGMISRENVLAFIKARGELGV